MNYGLFCDALAKRGRLGGENNYEIHETHERGAMMTEVLFKGESYKITGACFEVYKEKGSGFLEAVFQECMAIELGIRNIPYVEQPILKLSYKGHPLKQGYQPDFVCFGKIIVELKAVKTLVDEHRAQVINYLKATGMQLGLLVNFGHYPKVEIERFLNIPDYKALTTLS